MTRQQMKAVRELKAMDDVVILPADKGNSTVVMEKEEYNKKMMELLNTDTYEERDTDPTKTLEAKISQQATQDPGDQRGDNNTDLPENKSLRITTT